MTAADRTSPVGVAEPSPTRLRQKRRRLGPTVQQRRFWFVLGDTFALLLSLFIALWAWSLRGGFVLSEQLASRGWLVALVPFWIALERVLGVYTPHPTGNGKRLIGLLLATGVLFLAVYQTIYFFSPRDLMLRAVILFYAAAAVPAILVTRLVVDALLRRPGLRRRVLLLGSSRKGRLASKLILRFGGEVYEPVGSAVEDPRGPTRRYSLSLEGADAVSTSLVECVVDLRISDVILVDGKTSSYELVQDLAECHVLGTQIRTLSEIVEEMTGQVPIHLLSPESYTRLFLEWGRSSPLYDSLKRVLDVAGAIVGLTLLALFLIPVAPLIVLTSRGPLFYSQERLGRHGRRFRIRKLRTMIHRAEAGGAVWAERSDPRVTAIGRILRATGLDEFPQFWNVLAGEMSLVGPRPERPELADEVGRVEPLFALRTLVKPGLSGWALARSGYARTIGGSISKLRYDLYYIKHRSIAMDLAIIVQTVWLMLTRRGGRN